LPADYLRRTGYRLPTEAEWEYACRAGSRSTWFFGFAEEMLPRYACYLSNSRGKVSSVGLFKPNDFGLFDVYGNATEWTHTWGLPYSTATEERPHVDGAEDLELYQLEVGMLAKAPPDPLSVLALWQLVRSREFRVHRGGAYSHPAPYLRSAARFISPPDRHETFVGFRVARTHP
jgi:formylglycine-generating enzyme required for sulfatase activity